MAKTIIKEIIIALLLCLAIILILGVLLYGYVPTNKVIPEKVSYTTPSNIKEELSQVRGVDESEVILTYEVDSTDLNNYQKIKDYKPGKPNPFSSYETENTQSNTTAGNTTSANGTTGTTTNSTTNSSSGSTTTSSNNTNTGYFPDKGLK